MKNFFHNNYYIPSMTNEVSDTEVRSKITKSSKILARNLITILLDHENPDIAPSDGTNMIRLDKLKNILKDILKIDQLIKEHSIGNYND